MAQSSKVLQLCKISYHLSVLSSFKYFKNFPVYSCVDLRDFRFLKVRRFNLTWQATYFSNFVAVVLQETDDEDSEGDEEVKI